MLKEKLIEVKNLHEKGALAVGSRMGHEILYNPFFRATFESEIYETIFCECMDPT